jgi:hypothetical protein
MAVSARIRTFIGNKQRELNQVSDPHQAAATFFAVGKRRADKIKDFSQLPIYLETLNKMIRMGRPFSAASLIPLELYDVFGFINRRGLLMHSR